MLGKKSEPPAGIEPTTDSCWKLDKRKNKRSHVLTIDIVALIEQKTYLRTSYDFVHLADLAPVVQTIDNPISSR